jgi:hypothetical protein
MMIRAYRRFNTIVSTCTKSMARMPWAWAVRNCFHVGPERRGAGSNPAACRISHTVEEAIWWPSLINSPWMRRWPHSGLSFAMVSTSFLTAAAVGGLPGFRRAL